MSRPLTDFDAKLFYAGTHVAFPQSYLYPAALLRASLVVFIVCHRSQHHRRTAAIQ
jgi:hypothetical protein